MDFPVVVSFIIFLNGYYLIHYLLQTEPKAGDSPESDKLLAVQCSNGLYRHLDVVDDVFYFYRMGKQVIIVTFDQKEHHISDSLNAWEDRLRPHGFIRINRSVIFNFNIVIGCEAGDKRNTLNLRLERKYQEALKQQGTDRFIVTNEHIQDVLERFS